MGTMEYVLAGATGAAVGGYLGHSQVGPKAVPACALVGAVLAVMAVMFGLHKVDLTDSDGDGTPDALDSRPNHYDGHRRDDHW